MNKRTSVLRFLAFRKQRTSFLRMLLDGVLGRNEIRSREKRRYRFEALEERRVLATLFALDNANNVLTFDSATPGTISSNVAITGLFAGEQVVGIDTRPATGKLYALGLVDDGATRTGRIYTLDPTSGVAAPVGGVAWSTTLPDTEFFGFNFNPNVDRIRIVNRVGGNFRVHPDTGALVATDTNLSSTGLNGASYTNNDGFLATTTLFGFNYDANDLVIIGGLNGSPSPNGGVVNIIGDTGITAIDSYGFEITAIGRTTTAFATANGNLYTVNLSTGALTLAGAIGGGAGSYLGLTAALNTIAVAGSAADDTVVVTASGPSSGTYSLNGGPAVPFANIASFSFIGGAGGDALTINNPAGGLFAPTGGIDYHGGGQPGDALNLLGGGSAGLNQAYFVGTTAAPIGPGPGSNGDGLIRFTGTSAVDIRFTGLAPIVDTVAAASLTVNATDAANNISITNGAAPRLIVAVDAFEPIEFNNKTQLIVNAGDGVVGGDLADNVLLNFNNLPTGLTGITINADEGADTVSLQAASSAPVILNGGDGLDLVNIGNNGALGAPGLLTPIAGAVSVNGGAGGANLVVDGSGAGVAADYAITSTTVTRSLPVGFGGVTYSSLGNLLLTVGSGANVISVNSTAAGVPTNIATAAGDDSIVFANGVSLNGGTIDGGADIDTVNYSAYATSVTVNLGSNAPGGALAGVVDGGQENPGQITTATGTVSITNYNSATKTFDIVAHVSNLLPAAVTGFHIHRAPIGVNGGIIIDLATIFGLGSLIADGLGGFDFNAVAATLPAQHEAAFLGGITYFNVHTATAPGGLIRGQILPSAVFTAAPGTATGTGGISNIENATGGTGADSLVGSLGVNVLLGNQGNDTIVGAPGNDTMNGGDNNDVIVWSNGDNNDIIDGALGADVVQVNGSIGGGDNLTVGASGTRVAFARTNLVPFTLDIGTTETLVVNGAGGDDTETVNSLAGVADLTAVNLFGLNGNDTFNTGFTLAPIVVSVNGGSHTTGDALNLNAAGGPVFDNGTQLTKPGFNPVNYTQIENLAVTNIGELVISGSGLDDTLVVNATSVSAGTYQLNAGLVTAFTGISKLIFNAAGGNDTLTINNPAGGLFAPAQGIEYNGGGQIGDSLNLLGGGGAGFDEIYFVGTTTPPAGGTTNNGDGLIRFTGAAPVDIRFTGLAPIVDTVAVASLTVNSTDSANSINITNGTVAPRVRVAVDFFESIEFDNKTAVIVNAGNGVDGDDLADTINVSFTNTPAALTAITINGNEGIDQVNVFGTAGVDTVAFTPTGFSSASLTGLGAPVNFATTERVIYDGNDAAALDNVTINGTLTNDTLTFDANSLKGNFRSFLSPDFDTIRSARIVVNGGGGGVDVVNLLGSAGADAITSAANAITVNTTGSASIITLGAGIDAVTISTLDNNDNINLSGITVTSTVFGDDGDDTIVGSPQVDIIYGGAGNDTLVGGAGSDFEYGDEGNDIFGNLTLTPDGLADDAGADQAFGGEGFDNFVWEPGDGADVNNGGGDAADIFRFFGDANANVFTLRTGGTPTHFNALFGVVNIDNHGIEDVVVSALGGADTIAIADLFPTEVVALNLNLGSADGAIDSVILNGRALSDNLLISNPVAGSVLVAGLRYNVTVSNAEIADTLTVNGNDGDDRIAVASGANAVLALTLSGNHGNDNLDASTTTTAGAIVFNGGAGRDTILGGFGDDQIAGGADEDSLVGGPGNDTFDGGTGFDTILVRGTLGNDIIDISQTADVTLLETVNGVVETDTLALVAGTRTVERVSVVADAGNDTIRVQWADSLGTDANVNSLRVDVDGGAGSTGDRLGVVDLGTGDLILHEQGTTNDSGAMAIAPGNAEPLIVTFSDIETAQPIAGAGGDVVVFKHDPFEFNNARTLATYLGAGETINVDPTINPGLDGAFGFPADEDWFRVVAEKTGVLDFQVYFRQVATVGSGRPGLPNAGNLDIAVTDAAGNVITGFGNNDVSNDERIRIPAIAGQTYYLRVFANGNALNTYNITVDNYVPPVPRDMELLDNPVGDLANSDTGRSQFDNITRDNTPTLVFRLDDGIFLNDLPGNSGAGAPPDEVIPVPFQTAAGTAGYRIAIFDEGTSPLPGNQSGTAPQVPIGFATFVSPGVYQFTTPILSDGSHFLTARVQMVDPATPQQSGFGDRSVALEVIVDTVVPPAFFGNSTSVTDGLHRDSDSGIATVVASFADRITNDTTPTMYGSAEANAIIRIFVDRTNNGFTADDILLGQTVARPLDGTNQNLGEWDITASTSLNSPDLVAAIGKDGVRNLFITAEDVAGNVSTPTLLSIMIATTPAIVSAVTLPNGDSIFQVKPTPRPTPAVNFMTVTFTGGPASAGGFNLLAVDPGLAANVRNYQLIGDHSGNILISSAAVVSQSDTTVVVRLNFSKPLPDDRFTLTLDDSIADSANNALDGESQSQSPGLAGNVLPSGNGVPGGDFKARFTVDSRPEVGVVSEGIVYVDINGNYLWDPEGINNDSTNRDLVFQFGQLVDAHFAGNFAPVGAVAASGYDKLGAYGKFAGTYSFVLDTNDDGVADFSSLMPRAYQVNGIPVAGNFNAAHPGDEIGLFDGSFWYVDTNGNNQIDLGERVASNFNGLPIVGDFDGNGTDDFAAFNNSTNTFTFDTNRDGNADFTWRVADDVQRFVGLSGFTDRPVAGDLNLDGIDDIGLWVKDRQGTLPRNSGEYFFWVSDRSDPNPAIVFDSYSPDPLGNDLFAEFGDELGLPIFGNFDPPVVGSGDNSNPLHNTPSPLDVDSDGFVSPLDVLIVVNVLNEYPAFPSSDPVRTFYTIGQKKADPNNDRTINPLDVLTIINFLNVRSGSGEGESSLAFSESQETRSTDDFFAQLGAAELENDSFKKKRR